MTDQATTESSTQQPINVTVNNSRYQTISSEKKRKIALILCLLFGLFGGHLFYVGRIGKGILFACTMGLCFVGVVLDAIAISTGSFKDNVDAPLREW